VASTHQLLAQTFGVDPYRAEAFERLLSSATEHRTDRQRAVIAFQATQNRGEWLFVRRLWLLKREAWVNGLCSNQRRWQVRVSKNPRKGNHHVSWALREQYMRCQGSYRDYMPYAQEVRNEG